MRTTRLCAFKKVQSTVKMSSYGSGLKATPALTNTHDSPIKVQDHAIRAHYYTSLTGDDNQVMSVRQALRSLGFHPEVFKKVRQQEKG